MNILFLYAGEILPERGGVQRVTQVLADYFESNNIKTFYLSLPRTDHNVEASIRQFYLPSKTDSQLNKRFYLTFLKDKKINLVVNQSGISPFISNLAHEGSTVQVKVISVIHNSILTGIKNFSSLYESKAKKLYLGWMLPIANIKIVNNLLCYFYKLKHQQHYSSLYERSDRVILLSKKLESELKYLIGKNELNKVLVIPNPVSFKPETMDLGSKKKELLYVGRIDTIHKRVDLLLVIWAKLYRLFPDWKLKIVGNGPELEYLILLSKKMGLLRVYFEGFQSPESYYRDASIFCMTSSSESFGMVLLEAMQYGTVPFAFNSYLSVTDIIDNNKNGVLIAPFDCDSYTNKLSALMNDNENIIALAEEAIKKTAMFSIGKVGGAWMDIFKNVLLGEK